jgi:hypothetical protein
MPAVLQRGRSSGGGEVRLGIRTLSASQPDTISKGRQFLPEFSAGSCQYSDTELIGPN